MELGLLLELTEGVEIFSTKVVIEKLKIDENENYTYNLYNFLFVYLM